MVLSTILLVLCALRYATALNVNTLDTSNSTAAAKKACKLIKTQFPDLVSFPGIFVLDLDWQPRSQNNPKVKASSMMPLITGLYQANRPQPAP